MGWSHGIDTNREEGDQDIGYGVEAECDTEGCHAKIDRGLYHVCGSEPYGGDYGCGGFFCPDHLTYCKIPNEDKIVQLCDECARKIKGKAGE